MTATFSATTAYSLAEWQQWYEQDGKLSAYINLLRQNNPILDHALFKQGNQTDGHKGKIITSLPTAYFRRLYQGVTPSKAGIATVKSYTRQIAARWGVDIDEMLLYEGNEQNAFRLQQGELFIEALKQKAVQQMIYGDPKTDADQVKGLAAHYPTGSSPNVIDAGGSDSGGHASIWGVVWGDMNFHGIFPKNIKMGIRHEDLGKYDAEDSDGKKYRAIGDEWKWDFGFHLADWRSVVRIANIDVSYLTLTDTTNANYVDLRNLTIQAKNKIPAGMRNRMKWYVSESVMNALEVQAGQHPVGGAGTGNVHLRYGEWQDSKEVLMLHGKPVFECDGILETESDI